MGKFYGLWMARIFNGSFPQLWQKYIRVKVVVQGEENYILTHLKELNFVMWFS
jgi:hypothetical protein